MAGVSGMADRIRIIPQMRQWESSAAMRCPFQTACNDTHVVGKQRWECSWTLRRFLHFHLATFQPRFIRAAGGGNGVAPGVFADRRLRGNSRASCHGVGEKTLRSAA
jgi:hypothetical protein